MQTFSERHGFVEVSDVLQRDNISDKLRNCLWNVFAKHCISANINERIELAERLAQDFLKKPVDEVPAQNYQQHRTWLKSWFFDSEWHHAYGMIEFLSTRMLLAHEFNLILEREKSAYRFIDASGTVRDVSDPRSPFSDGPFILVAITEKEQLEGLSETLSISQRTGLDSARTHIAKALKKYSDRDSPDYENAIKEAISAVESVAKRISKLQSGGLSAPLRALKKSAQLHSALVLGMEKLYGYSSDEEGIRHALLDGETEIAEEDALYMILSCSAFCTYLITKSIKAGLIPGNAAIENVPRIADHNVQA